MRSTVVMPSAENATIRTKLVYLLRSTHFVPCLGTTTFTTIMAFLTGQRLGLLILIPMVLLGQFTVGWYNDYIDRDRDRVAGRQDKPIALGLISLTVIRRTALSCLVVSLVLGFWYNHLAGLVYSLAMLSALLYDYRLKLTPFSIVTLIVSFGLLPVVVGLGASPGSVVAWWMIAACACLGANVHFLNVIPDFEDDAKTGVKGFVHYFSYNHALLIGTISAGVASVLVLVGVYRHAPVLGLIIGLGLAATAYLFLQEYRKGNTPQAFGIAKRMTLVVLVILLAGAPYMLS